MGYATRSQLERAGIGDDVAALIRAARRIDALAADGNDVSPDAYDVLIDAAAVVVANDPSAAGYVADHA